ncbi:MAG: MptD family putative ECF transporter S component [Acutalibacteraceae bacterium]
MSAFYRGLFGGIFVLIWMLGFGVVGEVLASKSKYQNYKMLTVSFGLYSVGYYLGAIAPLYYYPAFWYGFDRPKETVDAMIAAAHSAAGLAAIPAYIDRNCDRCCNCKENVEEAF